MLFVNHFFYQVFGALDLIRLDFVNYQLKALRPTLLANSVQYEQSKFRSLLENNPSALDKTKNWISETARLMREGGQSVSPSNVLNTAFLRLLHEEVLNCTIFVIITILLFVMTVYHSLTTPIIQPV